jgi:hypothetical protein
MKTEVELSFTAHRDTTILGTPAAMNERERPTTPSPVIFPRPVSQALSTTRFVFSFRSKISLDVSNPLSLGLGARAIAPGISSLPVFSKFSKPWVAINPAIIDLAFLSLEPLKAFYPVLQL